MGKRIWVQQISWEEHSGSWFSEIGMIELVGSHWWYTTTESDSRVGPFLNPSQAAKQAAIDVRGLFTGKNSNDLSQIHPEPPRPAPKPVIVLPDNSEEGKKRRSELFRLSKKQARKRARKAACRNLDYIISGGQERDGYRRK